MIDLEKRRRVMSRSVALGHCICNPKQSCPCDIFREKDVCLCAGEKLPEAEEEIRLTRLVENAGCASKVSQENLKEVLSGLPEIADPRVLVGASAADDAGVFSLTSESALVQTVDIFTPNVDDPYIFGQIAAANSVSDIYAMGGQPLTALSVIAFPTDRVSKKIMKAILRGGIDKLAEANTVVIGGHSIKDEEIKFGFAVTGIINPKQIITNSQAQPGDVLVLTKPLGTGVLSFAQQLDRAPEEGLREAVRSMTELNRAAAEVMLSLGIKTATDITGFGLLGHLSEIVRQSRVTAVVEADLVPAFPGVLDCLRRGIISGATERNREYVASWLEIEANLPEELVYLLCDPQTSGGILMAVPPQKVTGLIEALKAKGVNGAIIGRIEAPSEGKIFLRSAGKKSFEVREAPMSQPQKKSSRPQTACCPGGPPVEPSLSPGEKQEKDRAAESTALSLEDTTTGEKFIQFIEEAMKPGVLSLKQKELIALALAAEVRCEPCFEAHLRKARECGLTAEEIREALAVATVFGGAPVLMFLEAVKEKLGL